MRLSSSRSTAILHRPQQDFLLWDKAGTRPSLDLQFADRKDLVDAISGQQLITHTRASSGTYVGSDGLIKTATTNLLLRNEEFDQSPWFAPVGITVTANAEIAPNGTLTADRVEWDAANKGLSQSFTGLNGVSYALSVWVKGAAGETIRFGGNNIAATNYTLTGQWQRLEITGISSSTSLNITINTFGGVTARDLYVWGAQLEQSSTVGEYIPTTSTINSAPRFDHDPVTGESLGLLVEESRTNLLPSSEDVDYAGYQRVGITTSLDVATVTAPDGTTTADEIAPTAITSEHFIGYGLNVTSGTTYTFSAYVKPNGTDSVRIRFAFAGFNNENGFHVFSTNTTTSGTCDFRITPVANGWYRIQGTAVASSTGNGIPRIYPNSINSWLGVPSEALYVWGAQLEESSFPTSYIPTEGSTVTRADDVASIEGANFSSWYRQDEGTEIGRAHV